MSSKNRRIKIRGQLAALEKMLKDRIYLGNPNRSIYGQYKKSEKALVQIRLEASKEREKFLYTRQETLVLEGKLDAAKAVKQIQQMEKRQRTFQAFRRATKPQASSGGLQYILIQEAEHIRRIDDITEMNTRLHHRNELHFSQAQGTPFTVSPLAESLGYDGCTLTAQTLIDQGIIPECDNYAASLILQELQRSSTPEIEHKFTLPQLRQGFQKWREKTTTSPSGKHLGILKSIDIAISLNLLTESETAFKKSNPTVTFDSIARQAMNIQLLLINLAIRECHTYERWKVVHNFFIEKKPGLPLIDKLRVIHIYEADWNIVLKYFNSYQLVRQSVRHHNIEPEQSGGRPNRSYIDEATKTVLTYKICRNQQLIGGLIYNDAKECFDRIVTNLSNLSCRREGLPLPLAKLYASTLSQIKYYLRHKGGISAQFNTHSAKPFHGAGQGAGDSPARWCFISDNLIRAYKKNTPSTLIRSPISLLDTNEKI